MSKARQQHYTLANTLCRLILWTLPVKYCNEKLLLEQVQLLQVEQIKCLKKNRFKSVVRKIADTWQETLSKRESWYV